MTRLSQPLRISLFLLLALFVALPGVTYAALRCRSDPVVKLSNGMKLEIGVDINADQSQVINVDYILHVPVGVSMAKPERTPGWSTIQETFRLIADQQPNQYYVVVTVKTTVPNVSVAPYANVKESVKVSYSTTGLSNQAATLSLNH